MDGSKTVAGRELGGKRTALGIWGDRDGPGGGFAERAFFLIFAFGNEYESEEIMVITLVILALSALFFMSGKVRSDLVAVCTLLALLVFQILTPEEGLAGFSNSVVVMMVGLFVVGGGIFQTGLAKMISGKLLQLAGRS